MSSFFSNINVSMFFAIMTVWSVLFVFHLFKPTVVINQIERACSNKAYFTIIALSVGVFVPWIAVFVIDWKTSLAAFVTAGIIEFLSALVRIFIFERKVLQPNG